MSQDYYESCAYNTKSVIKVCEDGELQGYIELEFPVCVNDVDTGFLIKESECNYPKKQDCEIGSYVYAAYPLNEVYQCFLLDKFEFEFKVHKTILTDYTEFLQDNPQLVLDATECFYL